MKSLRFLSVWAAAVVLAGASATAPTTPPPPDAAKVTWHTTTLAPGVALISTDDEAPVGNVGVSYGPDGILLIDDGFGSLAPKLNEALKALDPKPVRFVVNSHYHFDHSKGNEAYGRAGAVIVAHDNIRKRMSAESNIEFANYRFPASPREALPVVTFADSMTLHFNGDTIRLVHVGPGHTDGDTLVKLERANVLHTGDLYYIGGAPIIDVTAGGTSKGFLAALDVAISLTDANTRIIPGHGPLRTRAQLIAHRDELKAFVERVTAEYKAGKPVEQVLALKMGWKSQGIGENVTVDYLVRSIYGELKGR